MMLQQIRISKKLSRRELAKLTNISYRTIQDYEQGHKALSSAKGVTLYKLSLALGCSVEDLIEDEIVSNSEKANPNNNSTLSKTIIESQKLYSHKYSICGRWKFINGGCYIEFLYGGDIVLLPFDGVFTEDTLKWLNDLAELIIEEYVENVEFDKLIGDYGEVLWRE